MGRNFHSLEWMKPHAAARIRDNFLIDDGYREAITRLMWWNLLMLERWKQGEDNNDDILIQLMAEINRLDKAGFFRKDQRKPIREWTVFQMIEEDIRNKVASEGLRRDGREG